MNALIPKWKLICFYFRKILQTWIAERIIETSKSLKIDIAQFWKMNENSTLLFSFIYINKWLHSRGLFLFCKRFSEIFQRPIWQQIHFFYLPQFFHLSHFLWFRQTSETIVGTTMMLFILISFCGQNKLLNQTFI